MERSLPFMQRVELVSHTAGQAIARTCETSSWVKSSPFHAFDDVPVLLQAEEGRRQSRASGRWRGRRWCVCGTHGGVSGRKPPARPGVGQPRGERRAGPFERPGERPTRATDAERRLGGWHRKYVFSPSGQPRRQQRCSVHAKWFHS